MNSLLEVQEVEASLFVDVEEFDKKYVYGNITSDLTGVKISAGGIAIEGENKEEYKANLMEMFIRMRVFEMRPFLHIEGKINKIIDALSCVSVIWKNSELTRRANKKEGDTPINSYLYEEKESPYSVPKGHTRAKVTTTELSNQLLTIYEKCRKMESNFLQNISQLKTEIGNMLSKSYIYEGHADGYSDTETEVMVMDPFVTAATAMLPKYDGNPTQSFDLWEEQFRDTLNLITNDLTETQKLNRLKYCLVGRARQEFNKTTENTLDNAIKQLREQFQGSSSRVIAKQALAGCRQAPGEKLFYFANRLNKAVRAALNEEDEDHIQKRLFDEFLERILPDIRFHVKAQMPDTYTKAYELAENFELLLLEKDAYVTICDTNEINNGYSQAINKRHGKCFCCGQRTHNIKECQEKKSGNTSFGKPNVRFREKTRVDIILIACMIISFMKVIGAENTFDDDPIHKNRSFCLKTSEGNEVHIWDYHMINHMTLVMSLLCVMIVIAIILLLIHRKYRKRLKEGIIRRNMIRRERNKSGDALNFEENLDGFKLDEIDNVFRSQLVLSSAQRVRSLIARTFSLLTQHSSGNLGRSKHHGQMVGLEWHGQKSSVHSWHRLGTIGQCDN